MKKTCYKLPEEVEAAKTDAEKYEFVYIRELSRLEMGRRTDLEPINWGAVIEAQFFDKNSELRFFRHGGELKAALIEDDPFVSKEILFYPKQPNDDSKKKLRAILRTDKNGNQCMDTFPTLHHDGAFGKTITVREYFDYDADGQIFVTASRLVEWR